MLNMALLGHLLGYNSFLHKNSGRGMKLVINSSKGSFELPNTDQQPLL